MSSSGVRDQNRLRPGAGEWRLPPLACRRCSIEAHGMRSRDVRGPSAGERGRGGEQFPEGRALTNGSAHIGGSHAGPPLRSWSPLAMVVTATGIVVSSLYAFLADDPYRGLAPQTALGAQAQDVFSVLVAGLLLYLAGNTSAKAHLVRLGLLAYVAYTYAIYLTGVPMNRIFLVYVVLVLVSGAAFLHGLLRLRPAAWPRIPSRTLERGTGWMLVVVAVLFAGLWLTALMPYAFGGKAPSPAGPGGVAYPVYILDLVVGLPCIAAVGVLLLRGRPIAGPLAAVALIKIVTLFAALWAGVAAGLLKDGSVTLHPDAGPSALLLVLSVALVGKWLRSLAPHENAYVRATLWGS